MWIRLKPCSTWLLLPMRHLRSLAFRRFPAKSRQRASALPGKVLEENAQAIEVAAKPEPAPASVKIDEPVELEAAPVPSVVPTLRAETEKVNPEAQAASTPADTLFAAV